MKFAYYYILVIVYNNSTDDYMCQHGKHHVVESLTKLASHDLQTFLSPPIASYSLTSWEWIYQICLLSINFRKDQNAHYYIVQYCDGRKTMVNGMTSPNIIYSFDVVYWHGRTAEVASTNERLEKSLIC